MVLAILYMELTHPYFNAFVLTQKAHFWEVFIFFFGQFQILFLSSDAKKQKQNINWK